MQNTMIPLLLQATATPEAIADSWQVQVILTLLTLLATIATGFVPVLVLWLRKRLKLGSNAVMEQQVSQITVRGIHWAEEQAAKAIKGELPAHSSSAKVDNAVSFILAWMERYQLPKLAAEHVKDLIESHLPQVRNDAPGELLLAEPIDLGATPISIPNKPPAKPKK